MTDRLSAAVFFSLSSPVTLLVPTLSSFEGFLSSRKLLSGKGDFWCASMLLE